MKACEMSWGGSAVVTGCRLIAVVAFLVGVSGGSNERVETPERNIFSFGSLRKPFSLAAREIKGD
jgi:hypothetical protein